MPSGNRRTRLITKYGNRRLYDHEISRYLGYAELRAYVREGVRFEVRTAERPRDITLYVLADLLSTHRAVKRRDPVLQRKLRRILKGLAA